MPVIVQDRHHRRRAVAAIAAAAAIDATLAASIADATTIAAAEAIAAVTRQRQRLGRRLHDEVVGGESVEAAVMCTHPHGGVAAPMQAADNLRSQRSDHEMQKRFTDLVTGQV